MDTSPIYALQDIVLQDLLDIPALSDLAKTFSQFSRMPIAILDRRGTVLIRHGWHRICSDFHRIHPVTAARCLESDTVLADQTAAGETYNVYQCKNGLVDVAVPIIIEGRHLGNCFIGQFLLEPPDRGYFVRQAQGCGFDVDDYLKALSDVPVFHRDEVRHAINFLADLTTVICNAGLDKKRLIELNQVLQQRVEKQDADLKLEEKTRRTAEEELAVSRLYIESVFNAIQDGIVVLDQDLSILRFNIKMAHWNPQVPARIGEKCYRIFHQASKPCSDCPARRVFLSNRMASAEVPFTRPTGEDGTLELTCFPIRNSKGEVDSVVEYARDISDRIEMENEKQHLIDKLQTTLSQVKQLSGFLPICVSCKKIRDDAGYWNQVESYIKEHAGVEFSHSLCPECIQRLYPELDV